jgi:hypothetical protein
MRRLRRLLRPRPILAIALAAVALGAGLVSEATDASAPHRVLAHATAQHSDAVTVTIDPRARLTRIPTSFLGISTEYWALPQWAHSLPILYRVLAMVHGPGPLMLRIGGDSADRSFWAPRHRLPRWAYGTGPAWLREVARIVRHADVRIILDLNLITGTPSADARWARAALRALPPHSIAGFEIGNEPDLYIRWLWAARIATRAVVRTLPREISPARYASAFLAYRAALSSVAPHVPLLGPALADPSSHIRYVRHLLAGPHPGLTAVTVHLYPYSACAHPGRPAFPTIPRLLAWRATAGIARGLRSALRLARTAQLPLRLTELNSVTCGGRPGVSNSFATALWAPSALFALARAGVASADIHVRADAINAAFALTRGGLSARPLLYGMIAFERTLGPDPQLVALHLANVAGRTVTAWAVRSGHDELRLLVLDTGPHPIPIALSLPATTPATAQRLIAPSLASTGHVTIGGQWLGADGRWRGRPQTATIVPEAHRYALTLAPHSATLVSVQITAGSLR